MRKYSINQNQYFNFEELIGIVPLKGNETTFNIMDIYKPEDKSFDANQTLANMDIKFAQVEVMRDNSNEILCGTTHLGLILKHGDQAIGYDLRGLNSSVELEDLQGQDFLPDFILIRKSYEMKQRIWKI